MDGSQQCIELMTGIFIYMDGAQQCIELMTGIFIYMDGPQQYIELMTVNLEAAEDDVFIIRLEP